MKIFHLLFVNEKCPTTVKTIIKIDETFEVRNKKQCTGYLADGSIAR